MMRIEGAEGIKDEVSQLEQYEASVTLVWNLHTGDYRVCMVTELLNIAFHTFAKRKNTLNHPLSKTEGIFFIRSSSQNPGNAFTLSTVDIP